MDSSKKTDNWKCLPFFNIPLGTCSKMWISVQKVGKLKKKWTYPYFVHIFIFLIVFPKEFWKKEDTFNSQFFESNLNLQSKLKIKQREILISHRVLKNLGWGAAMKTYSEKKETSLFKFLGYIPNPNYSWRVNFVIRRHFSTLYSSIPIGVKNFVR